MKIKQIIPGAGWSICYHDDQAGEGVLFERVACFAIVTTADEEGDDVDAVVPMAPDAINCDPTELRAFFPEDLVGIVAPGDETSRHWEEHATQLLEQANAGDEKREHERDAEAALAMLRNSPSARALFVALDGATAPVATEAEMFTLVEHGLYTFEKGHGWLITSLGRDVLRKVKA